MDNNNYNDNTFKFIIIGFIIGFVIVILSIFIALSSITDSGFNVSSIINAYKIDHVLWVVSTAPFILGGVGYFVSTFFKKNLISSQALIEKDQFKTNTILAFTQKLINQDTEVTLELPNEDSILSETLIKLRDTIKDNKETENIRRNEDEQRHWVSEGLAKFGEILRSNTDNMEELSYKVIKNLVKYVKANQGGFFIIDENEENEKFFNLTSCYAYDRKKFADKQISWGEGLIGTCALEQKTIHLTEIPDSYITITSGLGKANPSSLLIVPLIVNDEIHGVLEIASFNEFKPFEIEFIEKVAESIATTISSVKINIKTSLLLKESQAQADVLANQEEQMRQNMEELQATQEEANRQSQKFISFTNSVNHTLIRAEYDVDGILLYANTKFLKKMGYTSNSEVEGKHISTFLHKKDRYWFDPIWDNLSKGGKHFEGYMKHLTKQNQDLWTMATYTCVRKEDDSVEKILFLAIDTTEQKKQSLDYEGQINALNNSGIKVIFSPSGKVLETNKMFCDIMGYTIEEARQKSIYDFLDAQTWTGFKETWQQILQGKSFEGQLPGIDKNKEEKWFNVTYSAVNDMYDEVAKIIYIGHDITKEKLMEIQTLEQSKQLKIQEEKLRQSGTELENKLKKAKEEMALQFKEIEKIKIRNEKTLEGALDAIITTNEFGTIEFFNKAAEELWNINRNDVMGKEVKMLFSKETIKNDDFVKKYTNPDEEKIIGERKEVFIKKSTGEEVSVLFLLSDATTHNEHTFTAFIQNVEVELF